MKTPILTTKLHIPAPPQRLVPRPRLLKKLESKLCCKLALICAPAGFGKSGLPMGIQIIGPHLADLSVLQLARGYEQAAGEDLRRMPDLIR